jgi:hypothetical protein
VEPHPLATIGGTIAKAPSRKTLAVVTVIIIALAVFAVSRWRSSGFHWSEFAQTFTDVRWGWIILSSFVIILTYIGRALRWRVMVQPLRHDSSTWNIFVCTAIGFTAIVFFGRAGELVRPYLISVKERVSFSSQMAAWLLERVLDLMMVLLIFGIALSQVPKTGLTPGPNLKTVLQASGVILGVAGGACVLMLIIFRYFGEAAHRRLMSAITFLPEHHRQRIDRLVSSFTAGFGSTRANGFMGRLFAYSVLEWVLISACFACVFQAFPSVSRFSLTDILIFMGFVSMGAAIQIPGVGGGMQVAAVLVLTELFGLSLELAAGFALALWAITFLVIVPIGILLALREGIKWRNLSHVSEELAS